MSFVYVKPYSVQPGNAITLPPTPCTPSNNSANSYFARKSSKTAETDLSPPFDRPRLSFETISDNPCEDGPFGLPHIIRNPFSTAKKTTKARYVSVSARHADYSPTSFSRMMMFAFSEDMELSYNSLKWLETSMMSSGDQILCIKHIPDKQAGANLLEAEYVYQQAKGILSDVFSITNQNLKISVTVEVFIGDVGSVVKHSVKTYEPSLVILPAARSSRTSHSHQKSPDDIISYLETNCKLSLMKVCPSMVLDVQCPWENTEPPGSKLSITDNENLIKPANPASTGMPLRSSLTRLLSSVSVKGKCMKND